MVEEEILPDGTILVTRRRYMEERALVESLQRELSELQAKWDEAVRGKVIVTPEEYERERAELSRAEAELRAAWSEWGRAMARLRWLYRRRDELRARRRELDALLRRARAERWPPERVAELEAERRAVVGELMRVGGYMTDARFAVREAARRAAALRRELRRIREELARKAVLTPELRELRERMEALGRRLEKETERLSRKVIANKLIAMHKRWAYASPRGIYHDISIEAVASIVVDSDEPKEKYEEALMTFLKDKMASLEGFERLKEISEEVVGFEEKLVHPDRYPMRGPELHAIEWWHKIFEKAQLKITDFLPGGPREHEREEAYSRYVSIYYKPEELPARERWLPREEGG